MAFSSFLTVGAVALALVTCASAEGDCKTCSDEAFKKTNDYRAGKGLPPFKFSESMYRRGQAHNRDMAARGSLFHTSLGDGVFNENVAYLPNRENLASEMVDMWIGSSGHERNMRSDNPCAATAIYDDGSRSWGTQMFGVCDSGSPEPTTTKAPTTSGSEGGNEDGECRSCSEEAFKLTNEYRAKKGLPPFAMSESMYLRSQKHNRDMAARGSLYHTSLGDGVMNENVAYLSNRDNVPSVMVEMWIDSPGHERNMRSDNPCAATAIYDDGSRSWGTQMFGICDADNPAADIPVTDAPRTTRPQKTRATTAATQTRAPDTSAATSPATTQPAATTANDADDADDKDYGYDERKPQVQGSECTACSAAAFAKTNELRTAAGLPALSKSTALQAAAAAHARRMAHERKVYHVELGAGEVAQNVGYYWSIDNIGKLMARYWDKFPQYSDGALRGVPCMGLSVYDDGRLSFGSQLFGECEDELSASPEDELSASPEDEPDASPEEEAEATPEADEATRAPVTVAVSTAAPASTTRAVLTTATDVTALVTFAGESSTQRDCFMRCARRCAGNRVLVCAADCAERCYL